MARLHAVTSRASGKRPKSRGLFWFRDDLRLADNAALQQLARQVDELLCVYVMQDWRFEADRYGLPDLGEHQWAFICESLRDLDQQLRRRGNCLIVLEGRVAEQLELVHQQWPFDYCASNWRAGSYEQHEWGQLKNRLPSVQFRSGESHTLWWQSELPFQLSALPEHFTPFRKRVEEMSVPSPRAAPTQLPKPPAGINGVVIPYANDPELLFRGGATAGHRQLESYLLESHAVRHYRETRNRLEGWDASSKLSPWLAHGCLSVREVAHALRAYEERFGANDSTRHLYFELLWREYFQWYARRHGAKLFAFDGIHGKKPQTSYYPHRFKQWSLGSTPYPIVNACMRQLNATGYMSNRGRQLAASCLVNELSVDWRYGAAYFQSQLIDHDLACNWGNWQYIAGVGADPRGGRHFNLQWQASQHDPQGHFQKRWAAGVRNVSLDVVDAADWPIQAKH